jgi:beta-lactam-binding protein with PASTA domain
MDKKEFSRFLHFFKHSLLLKNLILAFFVLVLLFVLVLFSLSIYTHHGEAQQVPNLIGLRLEDASMLLTNNELHYQVVDSVFQPNKQPGMVVEQQPSPGSFIKSYRDVYLTINARKPPGTAIPDVRDLSLRPAQALLQNMGIHVTNIEYVPSEFSNLVKDIKYQGRILAPGQTIPAGSSVTLVVGRKALPSDGLQMMPDLTGMNLAEATSLVNNDMLTLGAINFDEQPIADKDKANFVVDKQLPAAGDSIPAGKSVTIWLTRNKDKASTVDSVVSTPKKEVKQKKKKDIEKFF